MALAVHTSLLDGMILANTHTHTRNFGDVDHEIDREIGRGEEKNGEGDHALPLRDEITGQVDMIYSYCCDTFHWYTSYTINIYSFMTYLFIPSFLSNFLLEDWHTLIVVTIHPFDLPLMPSISFYSFLPSWRSSRRLTYPDCYYDTPIDLLLIPSISFYSFLPSFMMFFSKIDIPGLLLRYTHWSTPNTINIYLSISSFLPSFMMFFSKIDIPGLLRRHKKEALRLLQFREYLERRRRCLTWEALSPGLVPEAATYAPGTTTIRRLAPHHHQY